MVVTVVAVILFMKLNYRVIPELAEKKMVWRQVNKPQESELRDNNILKEPCL